MSTPRSFTCNSNTGEIFWAKSGLTEEKYNTIFSWAKNDNGFWEKNIIGIIEYEKLGVGKIPINGVLISIEIN